MKSNKPTKTILDATDKFSGSVRNIDPGNDLSVLGKHVRAALLDEDLKVSEVHPFFWSLVETYTDRFEQYPFDINKALISYLELKEFPEVAVRELIDQLETRFEAVHGRPLREPVRSAGSVLDEEIKKLRSSLKFAAMVAEENGS